MNAEWDAGVVAALRGALSEQLNTHELSSKVRALGLDQNAHPELTALQAALDYMDPKSRRGDGDIDEVFSPMIEWANGRTVPPRLSTVPAEWLEAWDHATKILADCDVVMARLHDLLWCRRVGQRPDLHARAAAKLYIGLRDAPAVFNTTRADWLARALVLASEVNDGALRAQAKDALLTSARAALASNEWIPGVSVGMIETLSALPQDQRPAELDQLLRDALNRYVGDPFITDGILRIQMQLAGADAAARQELARKLVTSWKDAAEAAEAGIVSVSHLERALEVARDEGLTAEADALRAEIQRPRSHEELGMQKVGTEVSISREEVKKYLDWFLQDDTVAVALQRFASHEVLPRVESARDEALALMEEAPIQHLFTRTIANSEGLAIRHLVTHDQKVEGVIANSQAMAVSLWGIFAVDILSRLRAEKGLQAADVTAFFVESMFRAEAAEAIGRAYEHHAAGRYEEAVMLTIPRIEAAVRDGARSIGVNVFAEPSLDGNHAGGYRGLGEVLSKLQERVPEGGRRYLATLLTDRLALNLRNRYMHGLTEGSSETDSALVIHAALALGTWRHTPEEDDTNA